MSVAEQTRELVSLCEKANLLPKGLAAEAPRLDFGNLELTEFYREMPPKGIRIPWHAEELVVYGSVDVVAKQSGYVGNVLTGRKDPKWNADWLVIADTLADPIFIDRRDPRLPVLFAIHGTGEWSPTEIAVAFEEFLASLSVWVDVCVLEFDRAFLDENFEMRDDTKSKLRERLSFLSEENLNFWLNWA